MTKTAMNNVTLTGLRDALDIAVVVDRPLFIRGPRGCGKTAVVEQWAEANGYACLTDIASQRLPEDFAGIPIPHTNKDGTADAVRATPDLVTSVRKLRAEGKPVVLFMDELPNAQLAVQQAMYELVREKRVGGVQLPDDTVIVLAGNLPDEGAFTNEIPTPLGNRMLIVNYMGPSVDEWATFIGDVNPLLHAYLKNDSSALVSYSSDDLECATPRSWEAANKLLNYAAGVDERGSSFIPSMMAGLIGSKAASSFKAFTEVASRLVPYDKLTAKTPAYKNNQLAYVALYTYTAAFKQAIADADAKSDIKSVQGAVRKASEVAEWLRLNHPDISTNIHAEWMVKIVGPLAPKYSTVAMFTDVGTGSLDVGALASFSRGERIAGVAVTSISI